MKKTTMSPHDWDIAHHVEMKYDLVNIRIASDPISDHPENNKGDSILTIHPADMIDVNSIPTQNAKVACDAVYLMTLAASCHVEGFLKMNKEVFDNGDFCIVSLSHPPYLNCIRD